MANRNPRTAYGDILARISSKLSPGERRNACTASQDQVSDPVPSFEDPESPDIERSESDNPPTNIGLQLIAGGIAGATSRTVTAPLDRIKVMLQVSGNQNSSITGCVRSMLQEGGVRCLWRGNFMNVIKVTPESAIKFSVHEKLVQGMMQPGEQNLRHHEQIVAGMLAGAISQSAIFPLDVLKTRLAIGQTGQYRGILDCAFKVYHAEGIRSFYKGAGINVIGAAIYAGIEMPLYGKLRKTYSDQYCTGDNSESQRPPTYVIIAITALASICGQFVAYPFALIRTKLQAQQAEVRKRSALSLFGYIVQSQGVAGLYRGLVPNMLKAIPAICITYLLVEKLNKEMGITKSF